MNTSITTLLLVASAALFSACVTAPVMQPRADVESIERQSSPTPTPKVGQHEAGRNAVDYANDRTRRNHGYGHPYGY